MSQVPCTLAFAKANIPSGNTGWLYYNPKFRRTAPPAMVSIVSSSAEDPLL
jgi:hypothetical protein